MDRPLSAVLLPGTGSDEVFVREVFGAPLAAFGISLHVPALSAHPVLAGLAALEAALESAQPPVLVGGISAGAHLAAAWALHRQERIAGLLLALPGWLGVPGDAPARQAARFSAAQVRKHGMAEALRLATDGVPGWLAAELDRAWRRHGEHLVPALTDAAERPAPDAAALAGLRVPIGLAGCLDDPVHPASVARQWAAALPAATLRLITMADLAADRESLGRAALHAWLRAAAFYA